MKQLPTVRHDLEQIINDIDTGDVDDVMSIIVKLQPVVQDLIRIESVR